MSDEVRDLGTVERSASGYTARLYATLRDALDDLEACSELLGEGTLFGLDLRRNIARYREILPGEEPK